MADGKQDGSADVATGMGIMLVVLGACGYLVWWLWTEEILSALRWVRYGEMWVVSHFVDDDFVVAWGKEKILFWEWFEGTPKVRAENLDTKKISIMTTLALTPFKWIVGGIISLIGLWAIFKGPGTQYRQRFNLDGLIKFQAGAFPIISPFVKFNPSNQPPRPPGSPVPAELPLFAEALGPEEWLAYNSIPIPDGKLDEGAAFRAFAQQLGPRWQGAAKLPPYKQILLASCCLKACRKRRDADDLLSRLAKCWSHDKGLDLKKDRGLVKDARKILKNRDLAGKMLSQCNQHAWQTTALLRGVTVAREEGGVLAPAQFVWLRGYDRALWYPLNNLGRHTHHPEALGAIAHYKAEKMAKRPIPRAKVGDAVQTMVDYMNSDLARPVPQIDYSGSKKRGIKKLKAA
ncbi:MAG: type IV secretion system protein [Rhodospirillales bacterium]|nr:type IV secretion system protein [Alphaproteobacteria bacterium]USO03858.1 MAG: type IV secretion system protein [Rhodospirillales bacterium]